MVVSNLLLVVDSRQLLLSGRGACFLAEYASRQIATAAIILLHYRVIIQCINEMVNPLGMGFGN